jgi:SMI1-KNR4 cell-wall
MPDTITHLIDQSLSDWESKKLNCHPGAVPEAMQTGEVQDDWKYWRALESTVTDQDIKDMEHLLGVHLSRQYEELLRHKHFIELQIGEASIFSHPVGTWKSSITKAVFGGYPKELLIEKGYLPFADYSDWGLLCFRVTEHDSAGESPIYRWDHERPEEFEFFAPDLRSALEHEATAKA